jgi:Golgi phosphoprotein 3 GPP34
VGTETPVVVAEPVWTPRAGEEPVAAVTFWLLRAGIDHTGRLEAHQAWNVAVRGAVLADLVLAGRWVDNDDEITIDADPSGMSYLDKAAAAVLSGGATSELKWIGAGRYHFDDAAADLVQRGEWRRRFSLLAPRTGTYRSVQLRQYVTERRTFAHVYDGDVPPSSAAEAAIAVLGHALGVIRPPHMARLHRAEAPLTASSCGDLSTIVSATISELIRRDAAVRVPAAPTW